MSEESKIVYPELSSEVLTSEEGTKDITVTATFSDGTSVVFELDPVHLHDYAARAFKDHVKRVSAGVVSGEHAHNIATALARGPEARRSRPSGVKVPTVLEAAIMELAGKTHGEATAYLSKFDPAGKRKLINDARLGPIYKRIQAERVKEPSSPTQLAELDELLG